MNGVDINKYQFKDHEWMTNMAGFNMPSDVYYGNILLGVIESKPNGYVIQSVVGPFRSDFVQQTMSNMFKSKLEAAKMLHKIWVRFRKSRIQKPL